MASPTSAITSDDHNDNDKLVAPTIDASPINPLERRNSLEKHLQTRPEERDLKNRNILLDTSAAP